MHQEDKIIFGLLKKEIAVTMMQSYPGIDPEVSNWKGQNITDFQEDLRIKVNGQISEKWFYMHMKSENKALPRIDVLNILSRYAGYISWQDFRSKMADKLSVTKKPGRPLILFMKIFLLLFSVMALIFIVIKLINTQNYRFSFIDSDTREPILDKNLRVELLSEAESPINLAPDESGSITVRTDRSEVNMVVKVPYYFTDTVIRTLKKFNRTELISLNADYYSLMISYFSRSDVESWEKRKEQLAAILSDDAIIYQFPDERTGNAMAIYNKWEFIDKITIPSSGLRLIEILDCRYLKGKVVLLRFRTKNSIE